MGVLFVFLDLIACDMPTTIAAGRSFLEAGIAVKRAAVERLFEAVLIFFRQIARILRERHLIAAAVAGARIPARDQRRIMIMRPATDLAGTVAERASNAHLGGDRLADEGAFVGKLVEKICQLGFDLEGDNFRLG